jgi:hypothetical protein
MQNQSDFIVKLVVDAWLGQVKRVDGILEEMKDEQLQQEIAPEKIAACTLSVTWRRYTMLCCPC